MKRKENLSPSLIIMNSIQWDVLHTNIAQYLRGIQRLVDILNKTKKEGPEVQLLFLSGVAYTNKYTKPSINGYLLRALNQVVGYIMRSKGIETLDVNTMLYSVNEFIVDLNHYMSINETTGVMKGQFGQGAVDLVRDTTCSGKKL